MSNECFIHDSWSYLDMPYLAKVLLSMITQILCINNNLTSIPIQGTGSYKAFLRKTFIFVIQA